MFHLLKNVEAGYPEEAVSQKVFIECYKKCRHSGEWKWRKSLFCGRSQNIQDEAEPKNTHLCLSSFLFCLNRFTSSPIGYSIEWYIYWPFFIDSITYQQRHIIDMPKIRTTRTKKAPEGFDEIEPTLEEFARKMKDGKGNPHLHTQKRITCQLTNVIPPRSRKWTPWRKAGGGKHMACLPDPSSTNKIHLRSVL